ncbi:hypothetical protein DB30_04913 [Enhygromyxa salina]|uniref:Uncharacterized protein n=1 Tax=Enhygromyxa salina TaxID=215803 RepID=A0A0C2CYH3_9BACT|nr:hypothetical protein DB30_04913 [Enhygromyxa salina]
MTQPTLVVAVATQAPASAPKTTRFLVRSPLMVIRSTMR